jgi:hypothetical protein
VAGGAGAETNLGNGHGVCGVGDGGARNRWSSGWVRCGTGAGYRRDSSGGRSRDQGDRGRDAGDNAWVTRNIGGANTGEVRERGLDLFLGRTPCLNAANDLVRELVRGAEAAGLGIRIALGQKREPGVDTLGHRVGAWGLGSRSGRRGCRRRCGMSRVNRGNACRSLGHGRDGSQNGRRRGTTSGDGTRDRASGHGLVCHNSGCALTRGSDRGNTAGGRSGRALGANGGG